MWLTIYAVCINGNNNSCDADGPMNLSGHNNMDCNMALEYNKGVRHSKVGD